MRLHVVGLPHTEVTQEYSWCAYTQKIRHLCDMMASVGHEVHLYGATRKREVDPRVIYHQILPKWVGPKVPTFGPEQPPFILRNTRALAALRKYAQPGDLLLIIDGRASEMLVRALPELIPVEWGIGYSGIMSETFHVFESYSWMSTVYGEHYGAARGDGNFYDTVIPNSVDPKDFPVSTFVNGSADNDYLLYMGRVIQRKGMSIVRDLRQRSGIRTVVAGGGDPQWVPALEDVGCEVLGEVGPEQRGALISGARAVLVPTLYYEPFATAHVEAQMSGTPVITTDWGVFPETVIDGFNGFRCRTLRAFNDAAEATGRMDHAHRMRIRKHAKSKWSTTVVKRQYDAYFKMIQGLDNGKDWYS